MKYSHYRVLHRMPPVGLRIVAAILVFVQLTAMVPLSAWAAVSDGAGSATPAPSASPKPIPVPTPPPVKVNRTVPKVTPPSSDLKFSSNPSNAEFQKAHVLEEPLVPIGGKTSAKENKALAQALIAFKNAKNAEDTAPLTGFLQAYPNTAWKASLLTNLGILYRSTGYWSKALDSWETAWTLSKTAKDVVASQIADRAVGELAELNSRLGRSDRLEKLFADVGNRPVHGAGAAKIARAKQGLWLMQNHPDKSFRCGPMALGRILATQTPTAPLSDKIFNSASTAQGMSLDQVNDLANNLGMKYQMAKRTPGSDVIVPAVVNWKVGHYAAIVKQVGDKYLIQDPTFTDDILVSRQALDAEASGYFLVHQGSLPDGWESVDQSVAKTVWGKGTIGSREPAPPANLGPKTDCPGSSPMTEYDVDPSRIALKLADTPVRYSPPVGPDVRFLVTYNQMEVTPVSSPTYTNLGPQWSCSWVAYIKDDPGNVNTLSYGPSGGTLTYTGYNSTTDSFAVQQESHSVLVRTSSSSYEMDFPDGSKQIYGLSDGGTPQKIYMTAMVDPAGNQLTLTYDSNFRLVSVTDAIGQVTGITYVSNVSTDPGFYLISKVTDPFGRYATFTYNSSYQLASITDIIGITSSYTYGTGGYADFVTALTTPYGETDFVPGGSGVNITLKATDPNGGTEFWQYDSGDAVYDSSAATPAGMSTNMTYSNYRNTYYWSKEAYMKGAGDVTKCRIMHWLHSDYDINVASDIMESEKPALESRIFYNYPGQTLAYQATNNDQPSAVGRVLDSGSSQIYQYAYNSLGKVTQITDPAGRVTTFTYDTNNIDLLEVYHERTGGASTDSFGQAADLLTSYTYNSQHLPLTVTDASGQTTTNTYYSNGELHTSTNTLSQTTTFAYDSNGYLLTVTGPVSGAVTTYTYDGYGRVYTITDLAGYEVTTTYDDLDRPLTITYPDSTTTQYTYNNLDKEFIRDRLGRKTHIFHDALRHPVAVQDPDLHVTQYIWCGCGALLTIIDPNQNQTNFTRDVESRVTQKTFADNSSISYAYENSTSRLSSTTDALGQTTSYSYNIDNTISSVSFTNAVISTPGVTFSYDTAYSRTTQMVDATGTTNYTYNTITGTATLGAGQLASVASPLANSTIAYSYDALGRISARSINGAANTTTTSYDSLGRITAVVNPLSSGSFTSNYVNQTDRLSSVSYPNGQVTDFSYSGNTGDDRLQEIKNLDSTGAVQSQFDYTYNPVGTIATWQQNHSGFGVPKSYAFAYDNADQLTGAAVTLNSGTTPAKNYNYGYDKGGNRTQQQIGVATNTSTYNNLNQLTGQSAGGSTQFSGTLSKWATVTVGGNPAPVTANVTTSGTTYSFDGAADLATGTNNVAIVATDASSNTTTNHYSVTVPWSASATLTYDLNGNLTNDGAHTYSWDAKNELVAINYTGTTNSTQFTYDGLGRRVKIIEMTGATVNSTKQSVWDGMEMAEERDASDMVTKRFYSQGEQIITSGTANNYFYVKDHLGSIREMTDSGGSIHARYDYDPYGRLTKVAGDLDSDFTYAGYYQHSPSGLNLTVYRAYNSSLGRWINRDPSGEAGGINLYEYARNNPVNMSDPLGLCPGDWFTDLADWTKENINASKMWLDTHLPWEVAGDLDTDLDVVGGFLELPDAFSHLGEGTGTWVGNPTWQNSLGILNDGLLVSSVVLPEDSEISAELETAGQGRALWIGNEGKAAALEQGYEIMQPSEEALAAWNVGDKSLMQAESAQFAAGARGPVTIFVSDPAVAVGPNATRGDILFTNELPEVLNNANSGLAWPKYIFLK